MLDIAKERGKSMEEFLQFDVCSSSSLFDKEGLMISATRSNIVQELEMGKSPKELPPSCIKTGYKVDVMVNVQCPQVKTNDLEDFGEYANA